MNHTRHNAEDTTSSVIAVLKNYPNHHFNFNKTHDEDQSRFNERIHKKWTGARNKATTKQAAEQKSNWQQIFTIAALWKAVYHCHGEGKKHLTAGWAAGRISEGSGRLMRTPFDREQTLLLPTAE